MTARPSGPPNVWIATAFNVVSSSGQSAVTRRRRTLTDAPVRLAKVRAVTDRLPHTLRSDALDNRERILDAARAVFAAEGLDVPMREIARRAGVGPATLYRHFPTKADAGRRGLRGRRCTRATPSSTRGSPTRIRGTASAS